MGCRRAGRSTTGCPDSPQKVLQRSPGHQRAAHCDDDKGTCTHRAHAQPYPGTDRSLQCRFGPNAAGLDHAGREPLRAQSGAFPQLTNQAGAGARPGSATHSRRTSRSSPRSPCSCAAWPSAKSARSSWGLRRCNASAARPTRSNAASLSFGRRHGPGLMVIEVHPTQDQSARRKARNRLDRH